MLLRIAISAPPSSTPNTAAIRVLFSICSGFSAIPSLHPILPGSHGQPDRLTLLEETGVRLSRMAYAMVAIAASALCVGHHMYTVGMSSATQAYFVAATMVIAVADRGGKIFSWIATMWGGLDRVQDADAVGGRLHLPFTVGGVTGVVLANAGVDACCRTPLRVVAHFHYVLSLAQCSRLRRLYYWFPKMSATYSETIASCTSGFTSSGAHLVFFRSTSSGFRHAPAATVDYPDAFAG